jgi:hypothetical protein
MITNLVDYATNYTTSLIFATPFAAAAMIQQTNSLDAMRQIGKER